LESKTNELETHSNNKNIRDLYTASINLKSITSLELSVKDEKGDCLQIPTVF
jgi:hypothetical protein